MTGGLVVRGGQYGITAHLDDLAVVARVCGGAGLDTGLAALELHGLLADPDLLLAAALDPPGAALFAADLLDALDGPGGMLALAADCERLDTEIRAAAAAYLVADRLGGELVPAQRGLLDWPGALGAALVPLARGRPVGAVEALGSADPDAVDTTIDLVTRFWSPGWLMAGATHTPDGRARVEAEGQDGAAAATRPPRGVGDLLTALAHRNEGPGGQIDVRTVTDAAGHRRVIVDLPGTKSWAPYGHDVTSLGTNVRSVTGSWTTYERGVLTALRRAGVRPDEPILFVGHSQGGIVAVNAARHLAHSREFRVAGVITAGAPIARLPVPSSVTVLALENAGDVIPHCDGEQNPDRANVTTVTVPRTSDNALANHELDTGYLPSGPAVDASTNRSVRAAVGELGGFLDGRTVRTEIFQVSRT